jgi:hypothetical protein
MYELFLLGEAHGPPVNDAIALTLLKHFGA